MRAWEELQPGPGLLLPFSLQSQLEQGVPAHCVTLRFAVATVLTASRSLAGTGTGWNTEEAAEIIFLPSGVGKIGGCLCHISAAQPCGPLASLSGAWCLTRRGAPQCWVLPGPRLQTLPGRGLPCALLCPSAHSDRFLNSHMRRQAGARLPGYR